MITKNVVRFLQRDALLVALVSTGIGCSEIKKIDEMKDNTSELNQSTKTLVEKTGEMKDKMGEMSTTTDGLDSKMKDLLEITKADLTGKMGDLENTMIEMYDSMRQGDGAGHRRTAIDALLRAYSLQNRVAEAGMYQMAFEFQVLGNVGEDATLERRHLLYQQALIEFFLRMDELAPKNGRVWPHAKPQLHNIMGEENRAAAFNAMAFAMHKVNRKQSVDPFLGRPASVYDLIVYALALKPEIESGRIRLPEGPHYVKEVLSRPDRVRQLLQTRYNMFAYGMLGFATNLTDKGTFGQLMSLLGGIEVDLSEARFGTDRLKYLKDEMLEPAAITARDMYSVGIAPVMTGITKFVLKRTTLILSSEKSAATPLEAQTLAFWDRYRNPVAPLRNGQMR